MSCGRSFATNSATAAYYERRAGEYDEWYRGEGRFGDRDRPGWGDEVGRLIAMVAGLPPGRTLDVACGTGYLTQHLRGLVVGVDQSCSMAGIARSRLPGGFAILGDALRLPVAAGSFDRVFTAHFYGHLPSGERGRFLAESRRVAPELVVVDSAWRAGVEPEQWQERILNDGSRHQVYKRYLTGPQLADELRGEQILGGDWFVGARTIW